MRDHSSHLFVSRLINEADRGPRLAALPENRPRRNQVAPVCLEQCSPCDDRPRAGDPRDPRGRARALGRDDGRRGRARRDRRRLSGLEAAVARARLAARGRRRGGCRGGGRDRRLARACRRRALRAARRQGFPRGWAGIGAARSSRLVGVRPRLRRAARRGARGGRGQHRVDRAAWLQGGRAQLEARARARRSRGAADRTSGRDRDRDLGGPPRPCTRDVHRGVRGLRRCARSRGRDHARLRALALGRHAGPQRPPGGDVDRSSQTARSSATRSLRSRARGRA